MTVAEVNQHRSEVKAPTLQELNAWSKYKCFSRRPREGARNIINCRWVRKWKYEYPTVGAQASTQNTNTQAIKVIRARLTVRGFKDVEARDIDNYAGSSQRYSQRMPVSEAACQGTDICTADISKAFLQGITYEEPSEATWGADKGGQLRFASRLGAATS